MSSIEAIEAMLRADPDDWEAWLVYADWLTDRGDVRGELVPIEHQLATETLWPEERRALERRRAAIPQERPTWTEGRLVWRCGFVIEALPAGWHAFQSSPTADLFAHPAARLLGRFDLRRCLVGPRGAAALAGASALCTLCHLDLSANAIGDEGAAALAASESLPALRSLRLCDDAIGDEGAAALARCTTLGELRTLDLSRNGIGPDGAIALGQARFASLEELLIDDDIGEDGVEALIEASWQHGWRLRLPRA